jgi:hypothetical protein
LAGTARPGSAPASPMAPIMRAPAAGPTALLDLPGRGDGECRGGMPCVNTYRPSSRLGRPTSQSTGSAAVLLAAILGTALAYMSDDMLNLAIPAVARDLHATAAGSSGSSTPTTSRWLRLYWWPDQWVTSSATAGCSPPGLLPFCIGAVLCATAFRRRRRCCLVHHRRAARIPPTPAARVLPPPTVRRRQRHLAAWLHDLPGARCSSWP